MSPACAIASTASNCTPGKMAFGYFDPVTSFILTAGPFTAVKTTLAGAGPGYRFHMSSPQLIMNRHFWGHEHGLDVSLLHLTETVRKECGSHRAKTWDAKIIDDELAMMCKTTIWHEGRDGQALRCFIDDAEHHICCHLITDKPRRDPPHLCHGHGENTTRQLGELVQDARKPDYFVACPGSTKSCPRCMMDYYINIVKDETRGWEISIVAFYNLGSLRSPTNWKWETLVDERDIETAPKMSRDASEFGPGMARHKWITAEKVKWAPEGEWAQLKHDHSGAL